MHSIPEGLEVKLAERFFGIKLFLSDAISLASVFRATASDSEPGHSFRSSADNRMRMES